MAGSYGDVKTLSGGARAIPPASIILQKLRKTTDMKSNSYLGTHVGWKVVKAFTVEAKRRGTTPCCATGIPV
jgi:hypothetical protein